MQKKKVRKPLLPHLVVQIPLLFFSYAQRAHFLHALEPRVTWISYAFSVKSRFGSSSTSRTLALSKLNVTANPELGVTTNPELGVTTNPLPPLQWQIETRTCRDVVNCALLPFGDTVLHGAHNSLLKRLLKGGIDPATAGASVASCPPFF